MIALGFVSNGMKVYISSRNAEVCAKVEKELNSLGRGQCIAVPADLSTDSECKRLAEVVASREQRIHVLVNNAGANWAAPLEKFPAEGFDKVMNLNVRAPFLLTKYCYSLLKHGTSLDDPGRIINIGSVDGLLPSNLPTFAYTSSKAAIHNLTKHLAGQLGKDFITVNAVAPGPFQSKMMAATLDRAGTAIAQARCITRIGKPTDMAAVCLFLSSPGGSYVSGAVIPVDGGGVVKANM